jgi:hypothetical protein
MNRGFPVCPECSYEFVQNQLCPNAGFFKRKLCPFCYRAKQTVEESRVDPIHPTNPDTCVFCPSYVRCMTMEIGLLDAYD